MENSKEMVIDTQDLSKNYDGVEALKALNLKVPEHSIFGFLGPNGAGKTTSIKLLLGLARPSSGSGTIFGQDIVNDSVEIREKIGYLAQDPRFYEYMSARETLDFKARFYYRGPEAEIETRVAETLDLVGLADKADRPIRGFSGGELQRLGIAQAQINHPDLLILDEPAASLDPMGRRDVLEVMERLREHTAIFYSTHILDDVQRVSDAVAILNNGKLVAQAPIDQLLGGTGGTVYSLTIEGDTSKVQREINEQRWVSSVIAETSGQATTFQVAVTDEEAAKDHLLRLVLADERLAVIKYGRRTYELEEVFLSIVEGSDNG